MALGYDRMKLQKWVMIIFTIVALIGGMYGAACGQTQAAMVAEEAIYLNGGLKASYNGQSRVKIPLQLPAYTKYLIIRITVNENERITTESLANAALGIATNGATSILGITSGIKTQMAQGVVDFYLFTNNECANLYVNKASQQCNYYFGRNNSRGGVFDVAVNSYIPYYYLCIRNPETLEGVPIYVEVTAVSEIESHREINTPETTTEPQETPRQYHHLDEGKYKNREWKF